jgi:hypothetical protein
VKTVGSEVLITKSIIFWDITPLLLASSLLLLLVYSTNLKMEAVFSSEIVELLCCNGGSSQKLLLIKSCIYTVLIGSVKWGKRRKRKEGK